MLQQLKSRKLSTHHAEYEYIYKRENNYEIPTNFKNNAYFGSLPILVTLYVCWRV